MTQLLSIEAFILAGGKSSRMGSDKGLLSVNGMTMTEHLIKTLNQLEIKTNIISGNKAYQQFGLTVVPDVIPDKGPLGGLYTALKRTRAQSVLLLSCDMPFIGVDTLQYLLLNSSSQNITVFKNNEYLQPMPGRYPASAEHLVYQSIIRSELKLSKWLSEQNPTTLAVPANIKPGEFLNLNSQRDLDDLAAQS